MAAAELSALQAQLEGAQRLGFFGPRPVSEQLAHAVAFAEIIERQDFGPADFLDLGSGGGLPGLLLATRWTEVRGTLLDASARRTAFLRNAVLALGFGERIAVSEGRAELLGRDALLRASFPLVVARSFAAPAVTAEIGGSFVHVGGALVVSEPNEGADRWSADGLDRLGFEAAQVHHGSGARIAVLVRRAPLDDRWPRAVGIPTKRPLW
jgi:16S rRNA (guanine527-N7)-methyltransferase